MKNYSTLFNKVLLVLFLSIFGISGVLADSSAPTVDELTHKITLTVSTGTSLTFTMAQTDLTQPIWIDAGSGIYTSHLLPWNYAPINITSTGTMVHVCSSYLQVFKCENSGNFFTAITVDNQPLLTNLSVNGNSIETLYVEDVPKLSSLAINSSVLTNLTMINDGMTSIPTTSSILSEVYLERNSNLSYISFSNKQSLTSLTVINNPSLHGMESSNCGSQFSTLVVTDNAALTQITCKSNGLSSCTILNNTVLNSVDLTQNALTTLDLSSNPTVTEIKVNSNNLSTLVPSRDVKTIVCQSNDFTGVSFVDFTALVSLDCQNNDNLQTINVSGASVLTNLQTDWSIVTSLNISRSGITGLYLQNKAPSLSTLITTGATDLTEIIVKGSALTALDVSTNTALTQVNCARCQLTSLNIANGQNSTLANFRAENNPDLVCIQVDEGYDYLHNPQNGQYWKYDATATLNNTSTPCATPTSPTPGTGVPYIDLTVTSGATIDFSATAATNQAPIWISYDGGVTFETQTIGTVLTNHTATATGNSIQIYGSITAFECSSNTTKITALDISDMTTLTDLNCFTDNAALTTLTANNTGLHSLKDISNELTTLSMSNNANLTDISVTAKNLTTLTATNNPKLTEIFCSNNALTTLNLSDNALLATVKCQGNSLDVLETGDASITPGLNLTGVPSLNAINLQNNLFSTLDLSGFTSLTSLDCRNNATLTTVKANGNTALTTLLCSNAGLITLEATNTAFTTLDVSANSLTTLDLSGNTSLVSLDCHDNALTTLDLSTNTALTELECSENALTALNLRNGNNANFAVNHYTYAVNAQDNPELECIRIDDTFTLNETTWKKDPQATWNSGSLSCADYITNTPEDASYILINVKESNVLNADSAVTFTIQTNALESTPVWIKNGETTTYEYVSSGATYTVTPKGEEILVYGAITELNCSGTDTRPSPIMGLSTSHNTELTSLECNYTSVTNVDFDNVLLTTISCTHNNVLTTLDVAECPALTSFDASNNTLLTDLSIANGHNATLATFTATGNTALKCIEIDQDYGGEGSFTLPEGNAWVKDNTAAYNNSGTSCGDYEATPPDRTPVIVLTVPATTDGSYHFEIGVADGAVPVWIETLEGTILDNVLTSTESCDITTSGTFIKVYGALTTFNASGTSSSTHALTAVDASGATGLTGLTVNYTNVSTLTTGLTSLATLNCTNNSALVSLDVSGDAGLKTLNCANSAISSLDLNSNTQLTSLRAQYNALTTLDVSNGNNATLALMNTMGNTSLSCILIDEGYTTSASNYWTKDATSTYNNTTSDCATFINTPSEGSPTITLGVTASTSVSFNVSAASANTRIWYTTDGGTTFETQLLSTALSTLSLSSTTGEIILYGAITQFETVGTTYSAMAITSMAYSTNHPIESIIAEYTNITSITASNTALLTITCDHNPLLTSVDVSANTALKAVYFKTNVTLSVLNLTGNSALQFVHVPNNALTALDLSSATLMTSLLCYNNALTTLSLTNNFALLILDCKGNSLTALELAANIALVTLDCSDNALTDLDVSSNVALTTLSCESNALTELSIRNGFNSKLTNFDAQLNPDLYCIEIDESLLSLPIPPVGCTWTKDATASWNATPVPCSMPSIGLGVVNGATPITMNLTGEANATVWVENPTGTYTSYVFTALGTLSLSLTAGGDSITLHGPITGLDCKDNGANITALDLSQNLLLTTLDCSSNTALTSLNLENNTALTSLTATSCTALTEVNLRNGANALLTTLDLSNNTALTCIGVDVDLDPIPTAWVKDASADWNTSLVPCGTGVITITAVAGSDITVSGSGPLGTPVWVDKDNDGNLSSYIISPATEHKYTFTTTGTMKVYGNITAFDCSDNGTKLTALNLLSVSTLLSLDCSNNAITSLDGRNNSNLVYIYCSDNQIAHLNVSQLAYLEELQCSNNLLNSTDSAGIVLGTPNTMLNTLDCSFNPSLGSLDVSLATGLSRLDCQSSGLTSLVLTDGTTSNTTLSSLQCQDNNLTTLEVSGVPNMTFLLCHTNQIATLNLSSNLDLFALYCSSNALTALDVAANTNLRILDCSYNDALTALDLNTNVNLSSLDCRYDALTTLSVRNGANSTLATFHSVHNTNLECIAIDVDFDVDAQSNINWQKDDGASWNNTAVTCEDFVLTPPEGMEYIEVTLSSIPADFTFSTQTNSNSTPLWVEYPEGTYTRYTMSNADDATAYTHTISSASGVVRIYGNVHQFDCSDQSAEALDISHNIGLESVLCDNNGLTTLTLAETSDPALLTLSCSDNALTALDVSVYPNLQVLDCYDNQLTRLDVSDNRSLTFLDVYNNLLTYLNVSNGNNENFVHPEGLEYAFRSTSNTGLTHVIVDDGFNPVEATLLASVDKWLLDASDGWIEESTPGVDAQTIILTVPSNAIVDMTLKAASPCTPAWIKLNTDASGAESGEYYQILSLSTDPLDLTDITTTATTITIYGAVTYLNVSNNGDQITAIDASGNTGLERLYCDNNSLTTLLLKDAESDPAVPALEVLSCDFNALTTLDVSACTALTYLSCRSNELSTLSLSANTALTKLHVDANKLTTLSLTGLVNIEELTCSFNQLTSLDASGVSALRRINCSYNLLTTLNVRNTHNADFTKSYQIMAFDAAHNTSSLAITVDDDFTAPTTGVNAWIFDQYSTLTWISL